MNAIFRREKTEREHEYAAVQFSDGRVFIGSDHFEARQQAQHFYQQTGAVANESQHGFMTASGKFLYRLDVRFL